MRFLMASRLRAAAAALTLLAAGELAAQVDVDAADAADAVAADAGVAGAGVAGSAGEGVEFFDTPIPDRRLLLVLDHSESMRSTADGVTRLTRLRDEVDALFGRLDEYYYLDVHCFNDRLAVWNRKLEPCSEENLTSATEFIRAQTARGQTATYDALHSALVESFEEGVQRIIFVTDGEPTLGTVTHPGEILRRLRAQNKRMQVPIDVLAFDTSKHPLRRAFLERLARDHGGRFVPLD